MLNTPLSEWQFFTRTPSLGALLAQWKRACDSRVLLADTGMRMLILP
jgi:hypothetical protein